jgi:hypothetical protein
VCRDCVLHRCPLGDSRYTLSRESEPVPGALPAAPPDVPCALCTKHLSFVPAPGAPGVFPALGGMQAPAPERVYCAAHGAWSLRRDRN